MNRLAIPVVLAAVVIGASAASAKEPPETMVCGSSFIGQSGLLSTKRVCMYLDEANDPDELRYLLADPGEAFELRSRPRPAQFYTVTFAFGRTVAGTGRSSTYDRAA